MIGGIEHTVRFLSNMTGYTGKSLIICRYRERCLSPCQNISISWNVDCGWADLVELHHFGGRHDFDLIERSKFDLFWRQSFICEWSLYCVQIVCPD